ncbi:DUF2690 domain-containing protein [Streptomyces bambusae]|uniref:helix-turn-helix domain-containing protein n=1 Tax=Streptomyces bambusae TaxID=1550616 RepID=UPI001CFE54B4|nr:DUF2690 domain-containing protein [Streptomyces bambusae]MCB5165038.1 DUF2690 domain-containing protein [Streptomyces bambusae]
MRRIKDASQLSYNRLADKTHYSRSSWERFLNGKQVPTRVAVEQFAAAAGVPPEGLLALLDAVSSEDGAVATVAGRAAGAPASVAPAAETRPTADAGTVQAPAPAPAPAAATAVVTAAEPEPEQAPEQQQPASAGAPAAGFRWAGTLRTAAAIVAGALLGSLLTMFVIEPADAGTPTAGATTGAEHADPRPSKPVKVSCRSDTCLRREPAAHDCQWDAVTVRETWLRGMRIQLRYSEACQAVWGRIENGNVGDRVMIKDIHDQTDDAAIRMEHDTYTRMLAVTPEAPWATVTVCGSIPSQKEQECSPLGAIKP